MMQGFISVKEASERFGYSDSHVRNLLGKGIIKGEKFAGVWMVDWQSMAEHRAWMERLGQKKHGAWAHSFEEHGAPASEGGDNGHKRG